MPLFATLLVLLIFIAAIVLNSKYAPEGTVRLVIYIVLAVMFILWIAKIVGVRDVVV